MIKFSIITCSYNIATYLPRNIESVRTQSYSNYEHILVDGYSQDGTQQLIHAYRQQNPGRVLVYQSYPKGIADAMNQGIAQATGDILIHLHADDRFYHPDVLNYVADFFHRQPHLDWIYGKILACDQNDNTIGLFPNRKFLQHNSVSKAGKYLLKFFNFIPHQAVFIKKTIFDRYGMFDTTLKCCMDYDFWLRIKDHTQWAFMDLVVSIYALRPQAQSSGKNNQAANVLDLSRVYKRYLNPLEYLLAKNLNRFLRLSKNTTR